jgi:hypothetical protein
MNATVSVPREMKHLPVDSKRGATLLCGHSLAPR